MENDPGRQLVRGHAYSNIISRDQAQVHIGDKHNYGNASTHNHTYYLCASSSGQSSQFLTLREHDDITENEGGLLSLKRRRSPDEKEHTHKLDKEESLERALSKLGKFSKSIQDQRIGKDAKKIVRRIALAIDAVKTQQAGLPVHSNAEFFTRMDHSKSDFKKIRKNLKIAGRVDVNSGFRRTRNTKLTQVIRKYDKIAFEQWEISLKTLTFESRNSDGSEVIDSLITLYLEPLVSGSGLPVTVRFGETRTHTGVSFINPVVLAYRIVPNESEVFKVIKNDDLEGLKMLLADGKATLRDCGEHGSNLLYNACSHGSPRCCQYLADKGVDIDRVTTHTLIPSKTLHETPLYLCAAYGHFNHTRGAAQCGEILLKSGADPTFTDGKTSAPVTMALKYNPIIMSSILVEGTSFLDLKNFRQDGLSLWLIACEDARRSAPWILQRLKDSGCNIAKKDDNGWNCLFHSVLWSLEPKISYELERLQYLLSIFDDIHARNVYGCTIFDHVDNHQDHRLGSYQRDLWYCALESAGVDISSHLVQHPRVPSYRIEKHFEYTPEHYHALKHLQSWDEDNFRSQMDRLLQEIPLDEDEALEMEVLQRKRLEGDFDDDSEIEAESESDNESDTDDDL